MAAELIAEETTPRDLRKALELAQASVAREFGIGPNAVSQLERRCDLLLSALRKKIEAMAGSLSLVAPIPDRPPVELDGIGERHAQD